MSQKTFKSTKKPHSKDFLCICFYEIAFLEKTQKQPIALVLLFAFHAKVIKAKSFVLDKKNEKRGKIYNEIR